MSKYRLLLCDCYLEIFCQNATEEHYSISKKFGCMCFIHLQLISVKYKFVHLQLFNVKYKFVHLQLFDIKFLSSEKHISQAEKNEYLWLRFHIFGS